MTLLTMACEQVSVTTEGKVGLDEILRSAVELGDVPGVVAIVTNRDSILYRGAFGVMDAHGTQTMRPDAIFRIASMTKPITSIGIMMLVEEDLIELDHAASDYLPELTGREVLVETRTGDSTAVTRPAASPITVRDLLRHTSGFGYAFSNYELRELASITDIAARDQPILHDPGTRWTYGMSTAFLGWIIEAISGASLPEFLQARIFEPLGMEETGFHLSMDDRHRLAAMYRRIEGVLEGQPPSEQYQPEIRGDGGLLSTADDYVRFLQMIIGRGERAGVRLVRSETIEEMVRNQLEDIVVIEQPGASPSISNAFPLGAGTDGFGLGFQISVGERPNGRPPGSLSWGGIANTHFWIDLDNDIGVVILFQLLPFYDEQVITLLTRFEQTLYESLQ